MKNKIVESTLNSCLIMVLFAGISYASYGACGFGAISVQCSNGSSETNIDYDPGPPPFPTSQTVTVTSIGTGISCDGDGNASSSDDFPQDQCYYTVTETTTWPIGVTQVVGPTQDSSTFDGDTCSGYCGG